MAKPKKQQEKAASAVGAASDESATAAGEAEATAAEAMLESAGGAGSGIAAALQAGALDEAVAAGEAAAASGGDVRAAVAGVLDVLVDVVASHVEENAEPRLTFDELLAAHAERKSFSVQALAPYAGHYIGNGINVTQEVTVYPTAQLLSLDPSYAQELLGDRRVRTLIVE